jgi:hypothetical protein
VQAAASPARTGSLVAHRRALLQEVAASSSTAAKSAPVGLGSTADKSTDRDLVGKLVLTITVQADFAPLQDTNTYQTFRADLQQNIAKAANVAATDVEVVSITPGSIVCLTIINYYSLAAEEQARILINSVTKTPTNSLSEEFQTRYGQVSSASGRWIKAKVPGERPAGQRRRRRCCRRCCCCCIGALTRGGGKSRAGQSWPVWRQCDLPSARQAAGYAIARDSCRRRSKAARHGTPPPPSPPTLPPSPILPEPRRRRARHDRLADDGHLDRGGHCHPHGHPRHLLHPARALWLVHRRRGARPPQV